MKFLRIAGAFLLVLNVVVIEMAHAAPPKSKKQNVTQAMQERQSTIQAPPEMPGVQYPPGKFLGGYQKAEGRGQIIGARFKVGNSSSDVIAWYRASLQGGGWTISPASRDKTIYANMPKSGASVTIQAMGGPPGCDVYLNYALKR